ncbi:MAG: sigma-E processing peptidase SpoIIGA [Clostridia bacterium]|nr:sigma-E processing peptidase SpoIIGA [Clostridia bacterium]
MEQTVYGDLLFFVNFCMDFQCLFLTAKLLHRPFPIGRGALSAALGALYACAALFLQTSGAVAFLADLSVCYLMCVGTFLHKKMGFGRVFAPFALYFGVSMAVGGVMSGMAALLDHLALPIGQSNADISSGSFFLLAALGGISTFVWGRFCQRRAKGTRAVLTLELFGKTDTVTGLVDTANLLIDPVGGRPVVFLRQSVAARFFPAVLADMAARGDTAALASVPQELARRVRLIPADTVTGKGLLFAVTPEAAWIDAGRGQTPVEILVAPAPFHAQDGECEALLPANLITE